MTEQSDNIYEKYTDSAVKAAPGDPSQMHFYPYGMPPADQYTAPNPQVGSPYTQEPPPYPNPNPNPNPNMWGTPQVYQQDLSYIRDYLPWSLINICVGGLFLGLIAVLFSYMTIRRKRIQNIASAQRWSKITLLFNIFIDIVAVILIIIIIAVYAVRARNAYRGSY